MENPRAGMQFEGFQVKDVKTKERISEKREMRKHRKVGSGGNVGGENMRLFSGVDKRRYNFKK